MYRKKLFVSTWTTWPGNLVIGTLVVLFVRRVFKNCLTFAIHRLTNSGERYHPWCRKATRYQSSWCHVTLDDLARRQVPLVRRVLCRTR